MCVWLCMASADTLLLHYCQLRLKGAHSFSCITSCSIVISSKKTTPKGCRPLHVQAWGFSSVFTHHSIWFDIISMKQNQLTAKSCRFSTILLLATGLLCRCSKFHMLALVGTWYSFAGFSASIPPATTCNVLPVLRALLLLPIGWWNLSNSLADASQGLYTEHRSCESLQTEQRPDLSKDSVTPCSASERSCIGKLVHDSRNYQENCDFDKSSSSQRFMSDFKPLAANQSTNSDLVSDGRKALLVLKENIFKYNSQEERERLYELGRRLSAERLLSNTSIRELIDLFDRYNDGESLDSIVTSVKHPGLSQESQLVHCILTFQVM